MDENRGRCNTSRRLLALAVLFLVLLVSGCYQKGGALVNVGPDCAGLEKLGYQAPFTEQDANDIDALGYQKCASFIRNQLENN